MKLQLRHSLTRSKETLSAGLIPVLVAVWVTIPACLGGSEEPLGTGGGVEVDLDRAGTFPGQIDVGGGLSLSSLCQSYAGPVCTWLVTCYPDYENYWGNDIEQCINRYLSDCQEEMFSFQQAVIEGRLHYDSAKAYACLKLFQTIPCEVDMEEYLSPCDEVFVGLVPAGGYCEDSLECVDDLECWDNICVSYDGIDIEFSIPDP